MAGPLCITQLVLLYWVGKILVEVCNRACSQLLDSGEIVTACDDDLQSYLGELVKGEQVLNWKVLLLSLGVCISFPVHYISLGMVYRFFTAWLCSRLSSTLVFSSARSLSSRIPWSTLVFSSARSLCSWIPWSTLVFQVQDHSVHGFHDQHLFFQVQDPNRKKELSCIRHQLWTHKPLQRKTTLLLLT